MDKKEILEKSRAENKSQDVYEKEVMKQANNYTVLVMVILATILFSLQIFAGKGINWGIYAIVFSATMTNCWVKYFKFHRRQDLNFAIIYTIAVLVFSGYHIYNLFTSSGILL